MQQRLKNIFGFMFLPNLGKVLLPLKGLYVLIAHAVFSLLLPTRLISSDYLDEVKTGRTPRILRTFKHAAGNLSFSGRGLCEFGVFAAVAGMFFGSVFALTLWVANQFVGSAFADSMFSIGCETGDLGYKFLHMLLGTGAAEQTGSGCGAVLELPAGLDALQKGMRLMLAFYSNAMLVFATFLVLYQIVSIVVESAWHGKAFGQRYSALWTPLRLVFGIGLLVPVQQNLSAGQWVIIKMAEAGSAFATNAWDLYLAKTEAYTLEMPTPTTTKVTGLVLRYYRSMTCVALSNLYVTKGFTDADSHSSVYEGYRSGWDAGQAAFASAYTTELASNSALYASGGYVNPEMLFGPLMSVTSQKNVTFWSGNLEFYEKFGTAGNPVCGQFKYEGGKETSAKQDGTIKIYNANADALIALEDELGDLAAQTALSVATNNIEGTAPTSNQFVISTIANKYQAELEGTVPDYVSDQNANLSKKLQEMSDQRGWVSAPVFYNYLARTNSEMASLVTKLPEYTAPNLERMRHVYADGGQYQQNMETGLAAVDEYIASITKSNKTLQQAYQDISIDKDNKAESGGNASQYISDVFSRVFVNPPEGENVSWFEFNATQPLAELSSFGFSLIKKSLVALGASTLLAFFTGGGTALDYTLGLILIVGLSAGFMLAFVIPLLPFIRMLTGILAWLVSIIHGIISVPIVAISHVTAQGEGIAAGMTQSAYFLMMQIFLRPFLMIVGLLLSMLSLSLMVYVLNIMFDSVVRDAAGGEDPTIGAVGQLAYSVIYCVIVYTLANTAFKLIDIIPDECLRWIGQRGFKVGEFGDGTSELQSTDWGKVLVARQISSLGRSVGAGTRKQVNKISDAMKKKKPQDKPQNPPTGNSVTTTES